MKTLRIAITSAILFALAAIAAVLPAPRGAFAATDAPPTPEMFAQHAGIALSGAGPYHRVTLPLAVYESVERADLGDLRVFNGHGEAVPHALLRPASSTETRIDEKPVPLFPIVAKNGNQGSNGDLTVEVRRDANGTLIALHESKASAQADAPVRGVIADASQAGTGIRWLRLSVGPAATPFHAYTIESSDDLHNWRLLKGDGQIVQLEHDGRRIERNTAEWPGNAGKYLRILWADPQQAPAIRAVTVGIVHASVEQPSMLWSEQLQPTVVDKNTYEYALPGHVPLEQLRIALPEPNTLAPIEIRRQTNYRRGQRNETGWQTVADTVVYRLQSPRGEVRSQDVVLNMAYESPARKPAENRLRLVVDARSGGFGKTSPSLQVGFVPHMLVFLARGDGPFTLAWGSSRVGNAALPLTTLVPGYGDEQRKLPVSLAELQMSAVPAVPAPAAAGEASPAMRKSILWAILIGGVLVLGGMVWRLLRQMKQEGK